MAVLATTGTPFVGYLSLTNGAPSATIPVYVTSGVGSGAYTLGAKERLVITNITVSSNEVTVPKITITDTAPTTARTLLSLFATVTFPPTVVSIPPGIMLGYPGQLLTATSAAVTAGKFVEIIICGVIRAN